MYFLSFYSNSSCIHNNCRLLETSAVYYTMPIIQSIVNKLVLLEMYPITNDDKCGMCLHGTKSLFYVVQFYYRDGVLLIHLEYYYWFRTLIDLKPLYQLQFLLAVSSFIIPMYLQWLQKYFYQGYKCVLMLQLCIIQYV